MERGELCPPRFEGIETPGRNPVCASDAAPGAFWKPDKLHPARLHRGSARHQGPVSRDDLQLVHASLVLGKERAVRAEDEVIALKLVASLAMVGQVDLAGHLRVVVLEPAGGDLGPGYDSHVQLADVFFSSKSPPSSGCSSSSLSMNPGTKMAVTGGFAEHFQPLHCADLRSGGTHLPLLGEGWGGEGQQCGQANLLKRVSFPSLKRVF
ncbi:hypothetical protein J165_01118 [Xanthomonas citri pv. citri]|nr:hypothetical protein J165_01118 [Xanthomonas citri pv. citri]AJZ47887.1 hypothetical protein J166_01119 [Xanthomonas citri pv. citri]AJZ65301.1 hypothetical protein J168_01118 [Xanthomonas citri pv. citri]